MEYGFNIHNICSHKVVDPIGEPVQSCSPKRARVDGECIWHSFNSLRPLFTSSAFSFHLILLASIRLELLSTESIPRVLTHSEPFALRGWQGATQEQAHPPDVRNLPLSTILLRLNILDLLLRTLVHSLSGA